MVNYDSVEFFKDRYQKHGKYGVVSDHLRNEDGYNAKTLKDTELIKEFLSRTLHGVVKKCLEVGCGTGRLSSVLLEYSKTYTGWDANDEAINLAAITNVSAFEQKDITRIKGKQPKFDFVFTFTVLQHLKDNDWNKGIENITKLSKKLYLYENVSFTSTEWDNKVPPHMNRKSSKDYENELAKYGYKLQDAMPNSNNENNQRHVFMYFKKD